MGLLGKITGALHEVGTIAAAVVGTLVVKNIKNGGGRDKKFSLEVIKNMPPNRLAERCTSSGKSRGLKEQGRL